MDTAINILAISGSLRTTSSNTKLLQAISSLAPQQVTFTFYNGLNDLPHFNTEIDSDDSPIPSVQHLRDSIKKADAVLISTPEYAKGVPGALKNALDWIVSSGEFMNKPVAIITASPSPLGGNYAHDSLILTLEMIDAKIVKGGTLAIPYIGTKLDNMGHLTDSKLKEELTTLVNLLITSAQDNLL